MAQMEGSGFVNRVRGFNSRSREHWIAQWIEHARNRAGRGFDSRSSRKGFKPFLLSPRRKENRIGLRLTSNSDQARQSDDGLARRDSGWRFDQSHPGIYSLRKAFCEGARQDWRAAELASSAQAAWPMRDFPLRGLITNTVLVEMAMEKNVPIVFRLFNLLGIMRIRIREYERGVLWREGEVKRLLKPGRHWRFDFWNLSRVETFDRRLPFLPREGLDLLVRSGVLADEAEILDLSDHQRALVWCDNRFAGILGPGLHAWWNGAVKTEVEVADIRERNGAFRLAKAASIPTTPQTLKHLTVVTVPAKSKAAFFRNGVFIELLPPGRHAYWNGPEENTFRIVDTREQTLDIAGQELLTSDKLAIRLNAVLSFRVEGVEKSLLSASDVKQSLYREAQLLLRAKVGERDLDSLMADKEALAGDMEKVVRAKAATYGLAVISFGIKDIILPGDIKTLLLKATEARKASEAATIVRREETAAMRHQLNTARILAENPTLMRLRELETVEKVAAGGKLKVVLGDKGLAERVAALA